MTDPEGTAVAYGRVSGDAHWLDVPDGGTFRVRAGAGEIVAFPAPGADRAAVDDAFETIALPIALQVAGFEVLHASGVAIDGEVVAFCAQSGTGKTTTAYALSRRGHALWADDAVVLEATAGADGVMAHPLPFRSNIRAATAEGLGVKAAPTGAAGGEPLPLRAVCLLERVEDAARAGIERVPAAEALTAVLPHSLRFDLSDADLRRRTVQAYLALAAEVPVLRVRFVASFATLDALLDAIEAAVA